MAETSSPGVWERFLTANRPKGDLASLDYSANPTGLPRRRAPENVDLELLRGSGNVRRALSESPAPLSSRESALESARRRSKTPLSGYGERSPPCSARGAGSEAEMEAGDLPRRRLSELANAMQSGQGVRDALSPCPVRRLHRGSPQRRSRTADATVGMAPSVLCGYGEKSVPPKRQLEVRDEGIAIRDKGRSSSGIPWRRLPVYDHKGLLVRTGVTGGTFESEVPMRSVTPYSQRLWSGDGIKELMTPERPRKTAEVDVTDAERSKASTAQSMADAVKASPARETPQSAGRTGRAVAIAISKAARCSDQQLESERSRCLAKFDRLCTPSRITPSARPNEEAWGRDSREIHDSFRPKRRVVTQPVTQPFSTDDVPASPAPRCRAAPQMMPSAAFLGNGPEPLRGSERHAAARRTWQLEMEMAKIASAAGRVAVATCFSNGSVHSDRTDVCDRRPSRSTSRPQSRPKQTQPQSKPQVVPPTISSPAIVVKQTDETEPACKASVLEQKASPQAVGKVVEMIDKIIGKDVDIPKSQPESEGFVTPPTDMKVSMEPEPESATSPSSPYPRLLSCAADRVSSVAKREKAPATRKQNPANAKGRDLHQGRRPTLRC